MAIPFSRGSLANTTPNQNNMKFYLQFKKDGAYLHGQAPNQRRCDLTTSDGRRYDHTVGFVIAQHSTEAADEAAAIAALSVVPYVTPTPTAREVLAAAERNGIDVTVGGTTYRLRCKESDRAAFAQLATLILTAQAGMTSSEKTAHRASNVMITDAHGVAHSITVEDYQELVVTYGLTYNALWTAAAGA